MGTPLDVSVEAGVIRATGWTLQVDLIVLILLTVPLPAGAFGPPPGAELSAEKLSASTPSS